MARKAFCVYALLVVSLASSAPAPNATLGRRASWTRTCLKETTSEKDVVECADGTLVSDFSCMANGHGQRVRCPPNLPHMCVEKSCGEDNQDHCCTIDDCNDAGGLRDCAAPNRPTVGDTVCVQHVAEDNLGCWKYNGRSGKISKDDGNLYNPYQIENFDVGGTPCWFREALVTKGPCPDCANGCPWNYLSDGICQPSCQNSACNYDYGDCTTGPCTADSDCAFLSGTACFSGQCRMCSSFTTQGACPSDRCMWLGSQCQAPPCQCNHEGRQERPESQGGDFCWLSAPRSVTHCQLLQGEVVSFSWARCESNGVSNVNCDEAVCFAVTVGSCDSIHDKDTCLNSLDNGYSPASPCVWCSGASNCGGNDCLPQKHLVDVKGGVEDTQSVTCQALRCPRDFPVCDLGDCVTRACGSGDCTWSEGENYIWGNDGKGTRCSDNYRSTIPSAFSQLSALLSTPKPEPRTTFPPTIEEQLEAERENRHPYQPPPCRRLSSHRRRPQVRGASGASGWSGASGTQVDCYEDGSHGGYSRNPGQPASPNDEDEGSIPDWIGGLAVLVCLACCIFGIFKFIKGMCCSSEQKQSGAEGARGSPPSQQV